MTLRGSLIRDPRVVDAVVAYSCDTCNIVYDVEGQAAACVRGHALSTLIDGRLDITLTGAARDYSRGLLTAADLRHEAIIAVDRWITDGNEAERVTRECIDAIGKLHAPST